MASATVYQVAEKAGVSIATVSRVLNNPEKVHPRTRERVLSAIDALGFVPKAEAAARARKGSGRIGVLAPFFTYPSFVARLRGVADALADSPFELAIYNVDSSSRCVGYLASLPVTRRIDGLIVMALPFDDEAERRLLANGLETVLIEFSRRPFSSVRIDDRAGGALAADYLLARGHRLCGFVGDSDVPDYALRTSDMRLEGYRARLENAGVELPEEYIALAPHSLENARRMAHRLFALPKPPTAIFAASDTQAMGVLKAARERGLAIPQDVAVVGFDDLDIADYIGLTTVRQPLQESGRVAVDLLLARLADPTRPPQEVWLPLTLVQRETA
ncbi:MAG: LacI family DNA-binding transcriptional regulator [Anaerolineae bacterium]